MGAARLVSPKEPTKYSAPLSAMVSNRSAQLSHSNSIRKNQEENHEGDRHHMIIAIPDVHTLLLEGRDVHQTRKQEGVEVFWVFQTWDNASRNNIVYLVSLVGCEIK